VVSSAEKDGPKQGAISCGQNEDVGRQWKAGKYGDVSFCSNGVIEYAKTHEKIKGAFLAFQKDAGQIYPGWKHKLSYSGASFVQAATFDWKKKAAAAAFLRSVHVKHPNTTSKYWADVGYFSGNAAKNKSGNAMNHPETFGPDAHVDDLALQFPPMRLLKVKVRHKTSDSARSLSFRPHRGLARH
jgi:hypothetical protein